MTEDQNKQMAKAFKKVGPGSTPYISPAYRAKYFKLGYEAALKASTEKTREAEPSKQDFKEFVETCISSGKCMNPSEWGDRAIS